MAITGNEKWDQQNERYDLLHGNRSGALWAEDRLRYDEMKDPSESTVLVRKAGWKRLKVGNSRYLVKAEKDPSPGIHRVVVHKVDPVTRRKLATETIDALPFGFDAMVARDYVKYGLQHTRKKDLGKMVYAAKVKARTKAGAMKLGMERYLRGRKSR